MNDVTLRTKVPREIFNSLKSSGVNISGLMRDLLIAHVEGDQPVPDWDDVRRWLLDNRDVLNTYAGPNDHRKKDAMTQHALKNGYPN